MHLVIGISLVMSVISLPETDLGTLRTVIASNESEPREVLITEGDMVTLSCNTHLEWFFCLWNTPQLGTDHKPSMLKEFLK